MDKESLFVSQVEAILSKEHVQWAASKKNQGESKEEKSSDSKMETTETGKI
jgi:hypothetical protein